MRGEKTRREEQKGNKGTGKEMKERMKDGGYVEQEECRNKRKTKREEGARKETRGEDVGWIGGHKGREDE